MALVEMRYHVGRAWQPAKGRGPAITSLGLHHVMIDALFVPLGIDKILLMMREGLIVSKGLTDHGAQILVPVHDQDPATVIAAHEALMVLDPDATPERERTYPSWRSEFKRLGKPEPTE